MAEMCHILTKPNKSTLIVKVWRMAVHGIGLTVAHGGRRCGCGAFATKPRTRVCHVEAPQCIDAVTNGFTPTFGRIVNSVALWRRGDSAGGSAGEGGDGSGGSGRRWCGAKR